METRHYWEENGLVVKYDNYNSNDEFGRPTEGSAYVAAASDDEADFPPGAFFKKGKVSRQDPMSHRIIEKRRRDRMNNCLADLSRLIPPEYLKKGRGRVEKTEIIEMAIRHLKYLQDRANVAAAAAAWGQQYKAGYEEAAGEAVRFLAAQPGAPALCARLADHLQRHADRIANGMADGGSGGDGGGSGGDSGSRGDSGSHGAGSAEGGASGVPTSSSETASSSGSSRGRPPAAHFARLDHDAHYAMDCERGAREAPPPAPPPPPLHAVTIHVDFQPCEHRIKQEPGPPSWRPH